MKDFTKIRIKSMTHKALLISMILHILLIITLFYFKVSEKGLIYYKRIALT